MKPWIRKTSYEALNPKTRSPVSKTTRQENWLQCFCIKKNRHIPLFFIQVIGILTEIFLSKKESRFRYFEYLKRNIGMCVCGGDSKLTKRCFKCFWFADWIGQDIFHSSEVHGNDINILKSSVILCFPYRITYLKTAAWSQSLLYLWLRQTGLKCCVVILASDLIRFKWKQICIRNM